MVPVARVLTERAVVDHVRELMQPRGIRWQAIRSVPTWLRIAPVPLTTEHIVDLLGTLGLGVGYAVMTTLGLGVLVMLL